MIGAGIVGIAVAYYLQSEGRSVLLLDRKGVAQEASFGNAGAFAFSDILPLASPGIIAKAPRWLLDPLGPLSIPPAYAPAIAPWLFRFWIASRAGQVERSLQAQASLMALSKSELQTLVTRAGLSTRIRGGGSLQLYESEREFQDSRPGWAARSRHGIVFEHVSGSRLAELQPGLSSAFKLGTYVPEWQTVADPFEFASALAEEAFKQGTRFQKAHAVNLLPKPEGCEISLDGGATIFARTAILACGAWSKPLARSAGDIIPLETERGSNTTLAPTAFRLRRQLIFGGHGFVITPLSSGIRVGGAVELGGLRRPPNYARSKAMLAKAARFLPGLRTEGGREWMGFRPSLPDSLPVIGGSSRSPRVVYAFGHGHLGLTQAAGTARLVSDLVAGRMPAIPLDPFCPRRF